MKKLKPVSVLPSEFAIAHNMKFFKKKLKHSEGKNKKIQNQLLQKHKNRILSLEATIKRRTDDFLKLSSDFESKKIQFDELTQTHKMAQDKIQTQRETISINQKHMAELEHQLRESAQQRQHAIEAELASKLKQKSADCLEQINSIQLRCQEQLDRKRTQIQIIQQSFKLKLSQIVSAAQAKFDRLQKENALKLAETARTKFIFKVSNFSIESVLREIVKIRSQPDRQSLLLSMKRKILELEKRLTEAVTPDNHFESDLESRVQNLVRAIQESLSENDTKGLVDCLEQKQIELRTGQPEALQGRKNLFIVKEECESQFETSIEFDPNVWPIQGSSKKASVRFVFDQQKLIVLLEPSIQKLITRNKQLKESIKFLTRKLDNAKLLLRDLKSHFKKTQGPSVRSLEWSQSSIPKF